MNRALLCILLCTSLTTAAQTITTIAGTGTNGYSGDGGPAVSAQIRQPFGIAIDSSGNVFFTDEYRVRKINTSGVVSTYSGTGTFGCGGWASPAPATSYWLCGASGLTVDKNNDLYIMSNYAILKVNHSTDTLSWFGGRTNTYGGDGGPIMNIACGMVGNGVCFDRSGNMFIADINGKRVRKINTGDTITSIAGTGVAGYNGDGIAGTTAQLNSPRDVCADKFGNVYVTDIVDNRIRKITPAGIITTIAGTGVAGYNGDGIAATSAQIDQPLGIACDSLGNIFFSDGHNHRIRKISSSGIITTIAGTGTAGFSGDLGPATAAKINSPFALELDVYGNVYFTDGLNFRIRKITYCTPPTVGAISGGSSVCVGSAVTLGNSTPGGAWTSTNHHSSVTAGSVSGLTSGIDTITYTVSNSCASARATKIVTVMPLPGTITGTTSICPGTSVMLSNATPGGNWSSGNAAIATISPAAGAVTGVAQGDVIISYTVSGCAATGTITVKSAPAPISGPAAVCVDSVITLTNTGGGTWSSSDPTFAVVNVGSGLVTGIAPGSATITYTLPNGCSTTKTINVNSCSSVGVTDITYQSQFSLYPNPANESIHIVSAETITRVTVLNIFGQVVGDWHPAMKETDINIAHLPPGVYIARVGTAGVTRFIKR